MVSVCIKSMHHPIYIQMLLQVYCRDPIHLTRPSTQKLPSLATLLESILSNGSLIRPLFTT